MSGYASQLAELTCLDDETVKQQILPFLATFITKQSLVNHLQDLLGPGPKQKTFIQSFTDDRFPPAPAPKTESPTPEPSLNTLNAISRVAPGKKTKARFPSKLPPPRKVDAGSFGGVGSVYRKGHDEGLTLGATPAGSSSGRASPAIARVPSPSRAESRTSDIHHRTHQEASNAPSTNKDVVHAQEKAPTEQEYTIIPTDEMKELQQAIALLRGDSTEDPTIKAKPCFCQGRRHALHSHVPLCLGCGLILCSIMSPSPMLLPSPPCPSCAAPILSTTSRAIILTQMELTLASLTQSHTEKIRMIREERQQAWKEKRKEIDLFPELQHQIGLASSSNNVSVGSNRAPEYNVFHERRRNIDIAMGRKVEDDGQRRSRVLRIESKGVKGKPTSAKNKKKPKVDIERSQQAKVGDVSSKDKIAVEQDEAEFDQVEEEEEDDVLDYDYDEQGDGPVADLDDDGFARHSSVFPPESNLDISHSNSWTRKLSFLPFINYVPVKDRTIEIDGEGDQDGEEETVKRQVPGSAPKEVKTKQSNGREKGKGKDMAKSEI